MAFRRARNPDGRMALGDHLRELRRRVVIAAVALLAAAIGGWFLYDTVYDHLTEPLLAIARERGDEQSIALNFAGLTAAFSQRVSIAICSASSCPARSGCTSCGRSSCPA